MPVISLHQFIRVLFSFCVFCGVSAFAAEFKVSGIITSKYFEASKPVQIYRNQFEVIVQGSEIQITTSGESDPKVARFVFKSNGEESQVALVYKDLGAAADKSLQNDVKTNSFPRFAKRSVNAANLELYPTPVPVPYYGLLSYVWVPYGAGPYLQKCTDKSIIPYTYVPDAVKEGIKFRAEWLLHTNGHVFPQRLVDYSDGNRYLFDSTTNKREKYPRPYSRGFTNSIFETTTWTNNGSIELPMSFKVVRFAPKQGGKTSKDLDVELLVEGTVTNVTSILDPIPVQIALPNRIRVTDARLRDGDKKLPAASYVVQDGVILPQEKVKTLPSYKRVLQGTGSSPGKVRLSIVYAIFITLTICGVMSLRIVKAKSKPKL